ncbi:MAG: right-handed parallel beta-helix repeat-containing protein [Verrucomicrobia bacterium]|nr:right-handed parallel beta-helix repeat-containing protein [Verrucomicrobiota bacterium]
MQNPARDPVSGGKGYGQSPLHIDYKVETLAKLLAAIERAMPGQVVYVDDRTEINMTGAPGVEIPVGVTLASGRGKADSKGALLYSDEIDTSPLFLTGGGKARVTGLRLRGPDPERRTEQMGRLHAEGRYFSLPNSDGIQSAHPCLEVDNCEMWGWSHAAIDLKRGAAQAHIHHNDIHHNQRWGLGYGVCLDQADALIEANRFDWCRHSIAGTGAPGTSYEARYNLVLENANSHSFDMHGGADRKDGTDLAGDWMNIHHNTFRATTVCAIVIRGRPAHGAAIHHNWFLHHALEQSAQQINAVGNMRVYQNLFGPDRTLKA